MLRLHPAGYAFACLLVVLPFGVWGGFASLGVTASGIRVDGAPLEPTDAPGPILERQARAWLRTEVQVDLGQGTIRRRTREQLGAAIDVRAITRTVERAGRTGRPLDDLAVLFHSYRGALDYEWPLAVDRARVEEWVDELGHEVNRPPRGARLDHRGRLLEISADGAHLERDEAVEALYRAVAEGRITARLPVTRIPSGVGETAIPTTVMPPRRPIVVSSYSTEYATRGGERSRAHNVATAASYLNGAEIAPFGRLSFNDRVGARSRERGYREAHVILNGEMVDGLGGGVCQVASTLHAAAFMAGLEMIEYHPHSRPSAYIPMGLDATVAWPNVDLVIENPNPFPLTVRAEARDGTMLVELLGIQRTRVVDWRRETLDTEPWPDRYVEDPAIHDDREHVSQRGIRGFTILRERTIRRGVDMRIEEQRIRYPPTPRIVRVAPGSLDPFDQRPADEAGEIPANPF